MNLIFSKTKKIELDSNWHLTPDSDSGVVLTFHEVRKRDKIEIVEKKQVKTGAQEDYLFEDKFYFTRVVQALSKYRDEAQNSCETFDLILEKTLEIDLLLKKLDKEFKQFK